jgi:hypothetical protein
MVETVVVAHDVIDPRARQDAGVQLPEQSQASLLASAGIATSSDIVHQNADHHKKEATSSELSKAQPSVKPS